MFYEDDLIELKWSRRGKTYYQSKGYIYTKMGDSFYIKQKDLSPNSHMKVKMNCDYCGEDFAKMMSSYTRSIDNDFIKKDACEKCKIKKTEETNLAKYGVKSTLQLNEVQEKIKETNLNKYGHENAFQNKEVQEKYRNTCNERYGVDYPAQNEEVYNKVILTNQERYGVNCTLQYPETIEKAKITLSERNNVNTSRQQLYLNHLLKGILNYPVGKYNIDILIDDIVIEYNGGGHWLQVKLGNITDDEFTKQERLRDFFLKRRGYKLFKFTSRKDMLPQDDEVLRLFHIGKEYLNNGGTNFEVDIDENYIRLGKNIKDYKFNNLRRIYEKTINELTPTPTN